MENQVYGGVSNESVMNATGKLWQEWFSYLEQNGANNLSHKDIVAILSRKIDRRWWCQKIANAYEVKTGKRIVGQTTDSGFQIGVTKTVNVHKDKLWEIISSEKGMNVWLGKVKAWKNDQQYETEEGIKGEITVLKGGSHFRMSWQPSSWKKKSTLQIRVIPKKEKSVLSFHHEGLPNAKERENMRKHWKNKILSLLELIEKR